MNPDFKKFGELKPGDVLYHVGGVGDTAVVVACGLMAVIVKMQSEPNQTIITINEYSERWYCKR